MKNNEEELIKIKFFDNRKEQIERYPHGTNYFSKTAFRQSDLYPDLLKDYMPKHKDYKYKDELILVKQNLLFEVKHKKIIHKELKQFNR